MRRIPWSLYGIVDKQWLKGRSVESIAEALIRGGAGIIQYRDKESETGEFYCIASQLRLIAKRLQIPLVINDRIDIALAVQADGVHLGQKDLPMDAARKMIGRKMILGVSIGGWEEYETVRDTKTADYIGVGALFPTDTKKDAKSIGLELVRRIRSDTLLPIIGIGGIDLNNAESAIRSGCDGVAVISAILGSVNIEQSARQIFEKVQSAKKKQFESINYHYRK